MTDDICAIYICHIYVNMQLLKVHFILSPLSSVILPFLSDQLGGSFDQLAIRQRDIYLST